MGKPCKTKETPLFDCLPSCTEIGPDECSTEAFIDSCTFNLCDKEQGLFDCFAQEHVSIAGTEVEFFHFDKVASSRDPLYDEAIERVFEGIYKIKVYLEYPEASVEVGENGMKKMWDGEAWIPRAELERVGVPVPTESDVIRVWNTPFFDKYAVIDQDIPGSGYFYNIIKVVEDGHLFDTSGFVGFKVMLKRSTDYTPERRIDSD